MKRLKAKKIHTGVYDINSKSIFLILLFSIVGQFAIGQYQIGMVPRVSPDKGIYKKISFTGIDIKYGSPSVNERQIWGDLVAYDQVWRAGANNATTISFSTDVSINDQLLKAGTYTFFIIPKEEELWTAIFNKVENQWGSFDYDQKEDALRVDIVASMNNDFHEMLKYSIDSQGFEHGSIILEWEKLHFEIDLFLDYSNLFKKDVEARVEKADINTKWVVLVQGAAHLVDVKRNLDLAMSWLNKAEDQYGDIEVWNKQYYPKEYILGHLFWTKAECLSKLKDDKGALEYALKMKELKGGFYTKNNKDNSIDDAINYWKSK